MKSRRLFAIAAATVLLGACSSGSDVTGAPVVASTGVAAPAPSVTEILLPPVPATTAQPQRLLGHVPPAYADSCAPAAHQFSGVAEALECNPMGDPQQIRYWQFDSRASMDRALRVWTGDLLQGTGDCRTTFDGHVTYTVDGRTVGDLVCSSFKGWAWSDWNTDILAVATDENFYPADFYQWWSNNGSTTD